MTLPALSRYNTVMNTVLDNMDGLCEFLRVNGLQDLPAKTA